MVARTPRCQSQGPRALVRAAVLAVLLHALAWRWLTPQPEAAVPVRGADSSRPLQITLHDADAVLRPAPLPYPSLLARIPAPVARTPGAQAAAQGRKRPLPAPMLLAGPVQPNHVVLPLTHRPEVTVPESAVLRFRVFNGRESSWVQLNWTHDAQQYNLELAQRAAEGEHNEVLRQARSRGAISRGGLEPLEFTDRNRQQALRAVHFQRAAGVLSYSASTTTWPLVPGIQDGLSWLVQLSARLAALREPARAGQTIELPVAGMRGELDVWRFTVEGRQSVESPGSQAHAALQGVPLIKLSRAALRPYDARIEAWLDVNPPHWPRWLRFVQLQRNTVEWLLIEHSGTAGLALGANAPQVGE